jgi:hypothetical protein
LQGARPDGVARNGLVTAFIDCCACAALSGITESTGVGISC